MVVSTPRSARARKPGRRPTRGARSPRREGGTQYSPGPGGQESNSQRGQGARHVRRLTVVREGRPPARRDRRAEVRFPGSLPAKALHEFRGGGTGRRKPAPPTVGQDDRPLPWSGRTRKRRGTGSPSVSDAPGPGRSTRTCRPTRRPCSRRPGAPVQGRAPHRWRQGRRRSHRVPAGGVEIGSFIGVAEARARSIGPAVVLLGQAPASFGWPNNTRGRHRAGARREPAGRLRSPARAAR